MLVARHACRSATLTPCRFLARMQSTLTPTDARTSALDDGQVALQAAADQPRPVDTRTLSLKDIPVRPYQERCIDAALRCFTAGHHRIGISSPTGSGKTLMAASIIDRLPNRTAEAKQHLVIVASIELARQTRDQLRRFLPDKTVELDQGKNAATGRADVTVGTIQTLVKRLPKYDPTRFKLIVIDEAHHAAAATYITLLDHFDPGSKERFIKAQRLVKRKRDPKGASAPSAAAAFGINESAVDGSKLLDADQPRDEPDATEPAGPLAQPAAPWVIGFTATFKRADEKSLRRAFDYIAAHVELKELIDDGWLAPVQFETVDSTADLSNVHIIGRGEEADFDEQDLSAELRQAAVLQEVLQAWRERASTRRSCLIFAVDVKHCIAVTEAFRAAGIACGYIVGEMKPQERYDVLQAFRNGEIPVLVNVNVLTEGTDIPEIDTVILARPTKSRTRYWQMVGRGLRISPLSRKTECFVLDFHKSFPGLVHWPDLLFVDGAGYGKRYGDYKSVNPADEKASILDEEADDTVDDTRPRKLSYDAFDPFGIAGHESTSCIDRSAYGWIATGENSYVLAVDKKQAGAGGNAGAVWIKPGPHLPRGAGPEMVLAKEAAGVPYRGFRVTAVEYRHGVRHDYNLGTANWLDDAVAKGDAMALKTFGLHACQTLLSREARWRTDPPTKKQVDTLLRMLEDDAPLLKQPYAMTKGQVGAAIVSLAYGGRRSVLTSLSRRRNEQAKRVKKAERDVPLLSSAM